MPIHPEKPQKVKLVAALMATEKALIEEALSALRPVYGPVERCGPVFPFAHCDFYAEEMGGGLVKMFSSFEGLVDPGDLVALKLSAIECEKKFLDKGSDRRKVNIDPGYVDRMKLVLATTKNASHRVYVCSGIYGDVELVYSSGTFAPTEWTYPDYRESSSIRFFGEVRSAYLAQLRNEPAG